MKKNILWLLLLTCLFTQAQNPVKNIGNITAVDINDQTVNITTDNAFASIIVYSADIIRVRIDKQKLKADFSYAVISQPLTTKVNISQNDSAIIITTDSLKATISKSPFAITFYNNAGEIISQDEKGLSTSWVNE